MRKQRALTDTDLAKLIAMGVRNAMEDFHCQHLSDAQMKELNPIIRNSIYTTLYALHHQSEQGPALYLNFTMSLIPDYWEEPALLQEWE